MLVLLSNWLSNDTLHCICKQCIEFSACVASKMAAAPCHHQIPFSIPESSSLAHNPASAIENLWFGLKLHHGVSPAQALACWNPSASARRDVWKWSAEH
jgi:hypothetical protein